jgi:outer membrane protein assembly factor BamB
MTKNPVRWQLTAGLALLAALALSTYGSRVESGSPGAAADSAKAIVEESGIKGGLVVVIGCDDPALLEDLRGAGPYMVHGLDGDPGKVAAARKHLLQKNLYGPVTVSRLQGAQLPYVDSLVNMIVVTGYTQIPVEEILRALSPKGVIADLRNSKAKFTPKPWPDQLDEWTHFLHDASNNAVSKDTVVGPPRGLRWTCGPEYARSHEHFSSMSAMVTAGGRIFYIIDEGSISSVYLPSQWKLVARDAFSGVLLWKKPIKNWEARLRGFRSGPPEIGRRMVAARDRLYVSLGYGQPVTVLDTATGKQIAILDDTSGARELLLTNGTLYVLTDDMTAAQHNERKEWMNQGILSTSPTLPIWRRFPRGAFPMYGIQRIVAISTGTGNLLWKRQFKAPGEIAPTTMAVDDGRLCLQTVSHLVTLNASDGNDIWRTERPLATSRFSWSAPTMVIHDGVVLSLDRAESDNADKSLPAKGSKWIISSGGFEDRQNAELVAFSLDDGKELWRAPYSENYNTPGDVFVIDGVVWVGNLRGGIDPGFTQGRDLKTGKVTATLPPQKAWGHHRCYRNKATVKWLMVGRGGVQFIDLDSGDVRWNSWVRGSCQYGIMPANGLIYAPHHSCACKPETLLIGLNAVSPHSSAGTDPMSLDKGPAYSEISNLKSASSKADWPTYRRDVTRSGYQNLSAPINPNVAWTSKLTAPVTAPVAADGLVIVAETDHHTVRALSASDGKPAWMFVADGRIDSPPTLFNGLCLFGTRNGFVYCLRASDGQLAWRFRAAPADRRIFAYEQLESAWPVHGSVLVDDKLSGGAPTVYFAAGRSSFTDGGIHLYALQLTTGKVLHEKNVSIGRGNGKISQKVLPDILSMKNNALWMRGLGVDKNLVPVKDAPHLFAPRGFLDDTWWHRTYWIYGTKIGSGYTNWPLVGNQSPAGRLLTFDDGNLIYGYGRMAYRAGDGHVRPDMAKDYKLFAEVLDPAFADTKHEDRKRRIKWTAQLPFVARSIVLTRDALLVAGGKSPTESAASHGLGTFWVASRQDGSKKAACVLPAPPVLDGMALTDEGVFVCTIDGSVACLQTKSDG